MTGRWIPLTVASVAWLGAVAVVDAGGWAIVTVRDMPEYAVAGQQVRLTFTVRQHGISPLDGLQPIVAARSGAHLVKASAVATRTTGEYRATLALPHPGNWTIVIDTIKFNESTLPELVVMAPGSPPPALAHDALGERLFVAKGCLGCHVNDDVQGKHLVDVGPDLTGRRFPDAQLRRLLADPKAEFGRDSEMPDLGLTKTEIAALTAFINRERPR